MDSFPHEIWDSWVIKFTALQWFCRLSPDFIMKPVSTPNSLFSIHLCCLSLGSYLLTHFHHNTVSQLLVIFIGYEGQFFMDVWVYVKAITPDIVEETAHIDTEISNS